MGKNKNIICYPIITAYETLAPKTLFPVNWEERLGKENVRYVDDPIFDENGNYVKTIKKTYITLEKVEKWVFRKKENIKPKNKNNALFKTYSQMMLEDEKENKSYE